MAVIDDAAPVVKVGLESPTSCFGACDGEVVITVADGAPTYEISVDPPPCGMTNPIFTGVTSGETVTITGLLAGAHAITVEDVNNCTDVYNNITLEPALLEVSIASTDPLCFGSADGTTTTTVTGGNANFTYVWEPVLTGSANETTAEDGLYTVTVTDDEGCQATNEVTLTYPDLLIANIDPITNPLCFGDDNGTATVNYSGGTANYDITWAGSPTVLDRSALFHLESSRSSGTLTVTITDANDCQTTATTILTDPVVLGVTVPNKTNVTCTGFCNGTADAQSTGGVGTHTYVWSNSATTSSITGL